jgi:hypothetical protein
MWRYVGIALVSSAALVYEAALTRIFAISQGYHFGFLAISLALLGFGMSGTLLALAPERARNVSAGLLGPIGLLFSISLFSGYLISNYMPFDAYLIASEPIQFVYLGIYLIALVVPFFLAGFLQGLPLMLWSERTAPLYSANLIGSGGGCLVALGALDQWDGPGAVIVAALVGSAAAFAFAVSSGDRTSNTL